MPLHKNGNKMDIKLILKPQFDSVFLVNGKLFEGGEIEYGQNSVVYITVLPLDAVLLPYTLMLVGGTLKCNHSLASSYKLDENVYHLSIKPRHNYVYSVESGGQDEPSSMPEKFFRLLKRKKTAAARELMTKELSASVDDKALVSFFDGFKDIISDSKGLYYLITDSDAAKPHSFIIKNSLIDNIVEI